MNCMYLFIFYSLPSYLELQKEAQDPQERVSSHLRIPARVAVALVVDAGTAVCLVHDASQLSTTFLKPHNRITPQRLSMFNHILHNQFEDIAAVLNLD
jgi:hypothetical protein